MKEAKTIIFIVHLIFGLYLINITFNFLIIPEIVSSVDKWIFLVSGLLILFGGFNYLKLKKS